MKWRGRRSSSNIEDRRGGRRGSGAKRAGGGLGLGAILILAASIFFPDAVPFLKMVGIGQDSSSATSYRQEAPVVRSGNVDDEKQFVGRRFLRSRAGSTKKTPTIILSQSS
jgi:predicted metalloprotease